MHELPAFARIPRHIGIIPDGNRRWALGNNLQKKDGYPHGIAPGLQLVDQMLAVGVREATFYGFTTDNTRRAPEQVAAFSAACVDAVGLLTQRNVSLLVVGNTKSKFFPEALRPYTQERKTFSSDSQSKNLRLNFLVNYDWRQDLSSIGSGNNPIETAIASQDISRIDLIIRWGGKRRLSGFLPVQSVYADIFVVETLWPDFNQQHLLDALSWYQGCDVTLGG